MHARWQAKRARVSFPSYLNQLQEMSEREREQQPASLSRWLSLSPPATLLSVVDASSLAGRFLAWISQGKAGCESREKRERRDREGEEEEDEEEDGESKAGRRCTRIPLLSLSLSLLSRERVIAVKPREEVRRARTGRGVGGCDRQSDSHCQVAAAFAAVARSAARFGKRGGLPAC